MFLGTKISTHKRAVVPKKNWRLNPKTSGNLIFTPSECVLLSILFLFLLFKTEALRWKG